MRFYDYLFELTEESENEGEQILCEETSLENAWNCLLNTHQFRKEELRYTDTLSTFEGEMLGLDTY